MPPPSTTLIFNPTLFLLVILLRAEPQVPCFFIFGDSLVDNGNNNNLRTTAKANHWPYGIDFPAGPTGRFTNGRNLADIIAQLLGFDDSIPPFSNSTNQDLLRGLNYASGGAGILDQTGANFGEVISLRGQLRNHETTISRIAKLVGGERAAEEHLTSCIYYVGMGNNDYLANYLPQLYSSHAHYTPPIQFAALLISQYSQQLRKLYDYGARKVAVFGVGKLGCIPQQLVAYGASDGSPCFETSNDVVGFFNENLELLINSLNIGLPNAKFVYSGAHIASYGNIKILREACCPTSRETGISCGEGSVACSNREEYYFWDECHPTEAAYSIAANVAYADMSPLLLPHPIHVW